MSSRMHDSEGRKRKAFDIAVSEKLKSLDKVSKWRKYSTEKRIPCTLCGGPVYESTATAQVENKRKHAPVCVKCVMQGN